MGTRRSGRQKFLTGVIQLLWEELKTINRVKIKSLYKIAVGYVGMKYFKKTKPNKRLQIEKENQRLLRETSYRLTS